MSDKLLVQGQSGQNLLYDYVKEHLRSVLGGTTTRKLLIKMPYLSSTVYCLLSVTFFLLMIILGLSVF